MIVLFHEMKEYVASARTAVWQGLKTENEMTQPPWETIILYLGAPYELFVPEVPIDLRNFKTNVQVDEKKGVT